MNILYRLHCLYILRYLLTLLIACLTSYCHARVSCSLPNFLQRQLDSPPCGLLLYGLGLCRLCWPQKEEIPKKYRNKYRRYSTCWGFVCVLLLFILLCIYFYCLFVVAPPPYLSFSLTLSLSLTLLLSGNRFDCTSDNSTADKNRQKQTSYSKQSRKMYLKKKEKINISLFHFEFFNFAANIQKLLLFNVHSACRCCCCCSVLFAVCVSVCSFPHCFAAL